MGLRSLRLNQDVKDEIRRVLDIKEINKSIRAKVNIQSPESNVENKNTLGSCFDIYYKLLLWEYLNLNKCYDYDFGDWSSPHYYLLNREDDDSQFGKYYRSLFLELESLMGEDADSKYQKLAQASRSLLFFKKWNGITPFAEEHHPVVASKEFINELIALGDMVNFDSLEVSPSDRVLFHPKIRAGYHTLIPDLIIGDTIIDVKTKMKLGIEFSDLLQLLTYLAVSKHHTYYSSGGGFDVENEMRHVGVYFSRYGYYWKMNLLENVEPKKATNLLNMVYKGLLQSDQFF